MILTCFVKKKGKGERERETEDEAGPSRVAGPGTRLLNAGKPLQIADCGLPRGGDRARHAVQKKAPD